MLHLKNFYTTSNVNNKDLKSPLICTMSGDRENVFFGEQKVNGGVESYSLLYSGNTITHNGYALITYKPTSATGTKLSYTPTPATMRIDGGERVTDTSTYDFGDTNEHNIEFLFLTNFVIPTYTFQECEDIVKAELKNVYEIQAYTFYNDIGLKSLLSNDTTKTGTYFSKGCNNLSYVSMDKVENLGIGSFENCTALEEVVAPNLKVLNNNCFYQCNNLKRINSSKDGLFFLPNVTMLNNNALRACYELEECVVPNVTYIGNGCFWESNKLRQVWCQNVETIVDQAFRDSSVSMINTNKQGHAYFPKLTLLSQNSFYKSSGITHFDAPLLTALPNAVFYNCKIEFVNCPEVTTIGNNVFEGCSSFKRFVMPKVKTIGNYSFKECDLESVDMPLLENYGVQCFQLNKNLKKVNTPNALTHGNYTFSGCTNLSMINSNEEGTVNFQHFSEFNTQEFCGCKKIKKVIAPNVKEIRTQCFTYCEMLEELQLGAVTYIEGNSLYQTNVKTINSNIEGVVNLNSMISTGDYAIRNLKMKVFNAANLEEIGLAGIAFNGNLTELNCPKLKIIGNQGLANNAYITELNLEKVESIGPLAFANCTRLKLFNFGNTMTSVPTLENVSAFQGLPTYKIVVPDALYNQWKTAENWSSTTNGIVDRIVKYSEHFA